MTEKPYTDADVELVADAIVDARLRGHRDWTDRIARAVLDALAAAGRLAVDDDPRHIIEFRDDGWTIMHPLACRPRLFECPVNRAAEKRLVGPPAELGRYECWVDGRLDDISAGEFLVGGRVDQAEEGR